MYNIFARINTSYIRSDGTSSVSVMCYIQGNRVTFSTGIRVALKDWDETKEIVRGNTKATKEANLVINNCKSAINDIFVKYRLNREEITPNLLKNEYKTVAQGMKFTKYALGKLDEKRDFIASGTYRSQKTTLNQFEKFSPGIKFAEIDSNHIEKYELHLKRGKKKQTYIYRSLKVIKTYISLAVKDRMIKQNPFDNVKMRDGHPEREYLTDEEIKYLLNMLKEKKLSDSKSKVLKYFIFSCMTGLRISDVRNITFDNIVGNMLVVQMHKTRNVTGRIVRIPLNEVAKNIMKESTEGRESGAIFYKMISDQKVNEYLKIIMVKAKIKKHITFHVGNHNLSSFPLKTSNLQNYFSQ